MKSIIDNYTLFLNFIDQYLPCGFKDIDVNNPLIRKLEELTEANNQFFFLFDFIQLKILFSSQRSLNMLGIESAHISPSSFLKLMHPDDLGWYSIAQTKLFNLGHQIFNENGGSTLMSTNFRLKNSSDQFINMLLQSYLFFTNVPYKTVFILHILTDISWLREVMPGYHFYCGNDPYYFRYPNEKILLTGNIFAAI
jgi:hypothetical protein